MDRPIDIPGGWIQFQYLSGLDLGLPRGKTQHQNSSMVIRGQSARVFSPLMAAGAPLGASLLTQWQENLSCVRVVRQDWKLGCPVSISWTSSGLKGRALGRGAGHSCCWPPRLPSAGALVWKGPEGQEGLHHQANEGGRRLSFPGCRWVSASALKGLGLPLSCVSVARSNPWELVGRVSWSFLGDVRP